MYKHTYSIVYYIKNILIIFVAHAIWFIVGEQSFTSLYSARKLTLHSHTHNKKNNNTYTLQRQHTHTRRERSPISQMNLSEITFIIMRCYHIISYTTDRLTWLTIRFMLFSQRSQRLRGEETNTKTGTFYMYMLHSYTNVFIGQCEITRWTGNHTRTHHHHRIRCAEQRFDDDRRGKWNPHNILSLIKKTFPSKPKSDSPTHTDTHTERQKPPNSHINI